MPAQLATFEDVAHSLIKETETRLALGECSSYLITHYKQRLAAYAKPFFGAMPIKNIDHRKLKEFKAWLAARPMKASSVNPIMSFISKVMTQAEDDGVIEKAPKIPRAKHVDCPRPAFSRAEYRKLLAFMKKVEAQNPKISHHGHSVNWEMRYMTTFMLNSFLRPGDLFKLKNKHIEVVGGDQDGPEYLRINAPPSKGHSDPIISMPVAVKIYKRTLQRQQAAGHGRPEDYVFLPGMANRRYAKEATRREFTQILQAAGLTHNAREEAFSMYSIRHSAIMFRLLYAKDLNLLTLARACRTSVEMIDRYYAKSMTAEMNRAQLHSFRHPTRYV